MQEQQVKPKIYRLLRNEKPISFMLQSRSSKRKVLLWFDEEKKVNREIRYSVNQASPFIDEQDGHATLEPIVFEDGMLHVSDRNQSLQKFLELHPGKGKVYEEKNSEKEAINAMEQMNLEEDAIIAVKELDLNNMKTLIRVSSNADVNMLSVAEIKHNARVLARTQPKEVMRILNDPLLKVQDTVGQAFEERVVIQKGKQRDIWLNVKDAGGKTVSHRIYTIPPGENKYFALAKFLQGNDGLEILKKIQDILKTGDY
tara:strand:- start:238 stop:1008 length:771 start_codon:yes stop_codon:yes gene_type:complete